MNWDVIGLHGFHTDPSSNGLFEALGCIIPKDYKTLELEATQQSLSLCFLSPTPIPFYRSQKVTCLRSNSQFNRTSYNKIRTSVSQLLIHGSSLHFFLASLLF